MNRDATPAQQLRGTLKDDRIAKAFEALRARCRSAPPVSGYTDRTEPPHKCPQHEKMVDDHEYFVGDGQRSLLLTDPHFETPKGASQEGGRFPSAPGTWHQDSAEVAIPLARFASVPFPGTLMVPGTYTPTTPSARRLQNGSCPSQSRR